MKDVESIFARYEAVRPRLPQAAQANSTHEIGSLLDAVNDIDAFVFDAFGVLNVGETPIEGAADRLEALRSEGCKIRILTNAASYDRAGAVQKFENLGMRVLPDEILTSRDATIQHLSDGTWGCIAADADTLGDIGEDACRLTDDPKEYDAVDGILFLSTANWSEDQQKILEQSLKTRPRQVLIANADLVAPRDDGFSLEPGYFGHALLDGGQRDVRFFGKPFPEVYSMVEATLSDIPRDRILMCGDTLHTDILGAAARGWMTALVTQDGLFAGTDTRKYCERSGIHPTLRLSRI